MYSAGGVPFWSETRLRVGMRPVGPQINFIRRSKRSMALSAISGYFREAPITRAQGAPGFRTLLIWSAATSMSRKYFSGPDSAFRLAFIDHVQLQRAGEGKYSSSSSAT